MPSKAWACRVPIEPFHGIAVAHVPAMAVNAAGFESMLERLSDESGRYFGDSAARLVPVARIERPFSSLLRLRIDAAGRSFYAFLKIFKPRLGTEEERAQLARWVQREYDATARLHKAFAGRAGLSAVRAIAAFPDHLAFVTEEAAGLALDEIVRARVWGRRTSVPLREIATRIGSWIRTYQEVTPAEGRLSLDERRAYLGVRLDALVRAGILTVEDRARAFARFDALADAVAPDALPLVAIHGDLCPANILAGDDGGVTILDFAMAKTGARYHDIAHLFMHLEFQRWRRRPLARELSEVKAALLSGFDRSAALAEQPLFQLMLLQHVVCHVALLAEQRRGLLNGAQTWLARRRWRRCSALAGLSPATPLPLAAVSR